MSSGRGGKRLRDVDTGERSLRLGLGVADYLIVLFLAHLVLGRPYWFLATPALVPAGVILAMQLGVLHLVHRGTHAALTPDGYGFRRQFSEHDALVAAGRSGEAADFYRAHLVAFPDDLEARCRLAELLVRQLGDLLAAERVYLQLRERDRQGRFRRAVSNGLIDIYREIGDQSRLDAELRLAGELPALSK